MGDAPRDPNPVHRRPNGAGGASGSGRSLDDLLHDSDLLEALGLGEGRGYIGGGGLEPHIRQAYQFVEAVDGRAPLSGVDLGSGGGIPGLVLALAWPTSSWLLVDSNLQRTRHLDEAVDILGISARVDVLWSRAEEVARLDGLRGSSDLVVARSFGATAVVAECGAPLLEVDGHLIISDPPTGPGDRWPDRGLAVLGLASAKAIAGCSVMRLREPSDDRYPRRTGIPSKRPLWTT